MPWCMAMLSRVQAVPKSGWLHAMSVLSCSFCCSACGPHAVHAASVSVQFLSVLLTAQMHSKPCTVSMLDDALHREGVLQGYSCQLCSASRKASLCCDYPSFAGQQRCCCYALICLRPLYTHACVPMPLKQSNHCMGVVA